AARYGADRRRIRTLWIPPPGGAAAPRAVRRDARARRKAAARALLWIPPPARAGTDPLSGCVSAAGLGERRGVHAARVVPRNLVSSREAADPVQATDAAEVPALDSDRESAGRGGQRRSDSAEAREGRVD